jgi:hypothetical protein
MKFVSLIALFVALLFALFVASLSAGAQQENVPSVSKRIQRTYWKGEFRGEAFGGLVECAGPIDVWFFKMKPESFSQGVSTISYRHKVDASNSSWLCQALVGALSPISMDECEPDFPKKKAPREGNRLVPYRTIIPVEGGNSAVISAPSCDHFTHQVRHDVAARLARLEFSPDEQTLQVTIQPEGLPAGFTYVLHRRR